MRLEDNPLFAQLLSLDLPTDDYAVFGGGPLYAHGLKEELHDLDIIARGEALRRVRELGEVKEAKLGGEVVNLFGESLEFFDTWAPGQWDPDRLIDTADVIEGVRFVGLMHVLEWKKRMGRPKDLDDIARIEEHLKKNS